MQGFERGLDEKVGCIGDEEGRVREGDGNNVDEGHVRNVRGAAEEGDEGPGNVGKVGGGLWGGEVVQGFGDRGDDLYVYKLMTKK